MRGVVTMVTVVLQVGVGTGTTTPTEGMRNVETIVGPIGRRAGAEGVGDVKADPKRTA